MNVISGRSDLKVKLISVQLDHKKQSKINER